MSSLPHPVPSRMAQNVAARFGHEDETLLAWQRFCVQAAEALRAQHDPERLTKALALAQGGHVEVEDDGFRRRHQWHQTLPRPGGRQL